MTNVDGTPSGLVLEVEFLEAGVFVWRALDNTWGGIGQPPLVVRNSFNRQVQSFNRSTPFTFEVMQRGLGMVLHGFQRVRVRDSSGLPYFFIGYTQLEHSWNEGFNEHHWEITCVSSHIALTKGRAAQITDRIHIPAGQTDQLILGGGTFVISNWAASTVYSQAQTVKPTSSPAYYFECAGVGAAAFVAATVYTKGRGVLPTSGNPNAWFELTTAAGVATAEPNFASAPQVGNTVSLGGNTWTNRGDPAVPMSASVESGTNGNAAWTTTVGATTVLGNVTWRNMGTLAWAGLLPTYAPELTSLGLNTVCASCPAFDWENVTLLTAIDDLRGIASVSQQAAYTVSVNNSGDAVFTWFDAKNNTYIPLTTATLTDDPSDPNGIYTDKLDRTLDDQSVYNWITVAGDPQSGASWYIDGSKVGLAYTVNPATDVFALTAHGFGANRLLYFYNPVLAAGDSLPAPLVENAALTTPAYYVYNQHTNDFQLSLMLDGKAQGSIKIAAANAVVGSNLTVGAVSYTFVASGPGANKIVVGSTNTVTAANIVARVNTDTATTTCTAAVSATDARLVTLTANTAGTGGNSTVLTTTSANVALTAFHGGGALNITTAGVGTNIVSSSQHYDYYASQSYNYYGTLITTETVVDTTLTTNAQCFARGRQLIAGSYKAHDTLEATIYNKSIDSMGVPTPRRMNVTNSAEGLLNTPYALTREDLLVDNDGIFYRKLLLGDNWQDNNERAQVRNLGGGFVGDTGNPNPPTWPDYPDFILSNIYVPAVGDAHATATIHVLHNPNTESDMYQYMYRITQFDVVVATRFNLHPTCDLVVSNLAVNTPVTVEVCAFDVNSRPSNPYNSAWPSVTFTTANQPKPDPPTITSIVGGYNPWLGHFTEVLVTPAVGSDTSGGGLVAYVPHLGGQSRPVFIPENAVYPYTAIVGHIAAGIQYDYEASVRDMYLQWSDASAVVSYTIGGPPNINPGGSSWDYTHLDIAVPGYTTTTPAGTTASVVTSGAGASTYGGRSSLVFTVT